MKTRMIHFYHNSIKLISDTTNIFQIPILQHAIYFK